MRAVVQRVLEASVRVNGEILGEIGPGLLLFLGVARDDSEQQADRLLDRILRLRIFEDPEGKMNLSLSDRAGGLLVVSQFTLLADLSKGNRPSFGPAALPEHAKPLYDRFIQKAREQHPGLVATGRFGADMKVALTNDGPVTFVLDV